MNKIESARGSMSRAIASLTTCTLLAGLVALSAALPVSRAQAAEPAAQAKPVASTHTVSIPVEGMSCSACAAKIKRSAQAVKGVTSVEMDLANRYARVTYLEGTTSPQQITAAIAALGYKTGTPQMDHSR